MSSKLGSLALLFLAACAADPVSSAAAPDVGRPLFAKGKPASNPRATFYISNDAGNNMRGDAVGAYIEPATSPFAGSSRYQDGECGVGSEIFALPGGSGDAIMGTARTQARKCADFPRQVRITYERVNPDGTLTPEGSISGGTFMNVRQIHRVPGSTTTSTVIPVGATVERTMAFDDGGYRCGTAGGAAIVFSPLLNDGTVTGADMVLVERTAADTWVVSTRPPEVHPVTGVVTYRDKAYCRGNGALYRMPLRVVIRSSEPLEL